MTAPVYLDRPKGIDRGADPLMSLEDGCEPLRTLVCRSQWYFAYMTGIDRTPIGAAWEKRRRDPQPGDLVYIPDRVLSDRTDQYGPGPEDNCRWENAQCLVIATRECLEDVERILDSSGM